MSHVTVIYAALPGVCLSGCFGMTGWLSHVCACAQRARTPQKSYLVCTYVRVMVCVYVSV